MVAGGDRPSPTEAAAETLSPFEEMVLRRKRSKEWRKAYHPQSGKRAGKFYLSGILSF